MEVTGKLNLFVTIVGEKAFYEASLSRKNLDETFAHARISVEFGKTNFPKEVLAKLKENTCYVINVTKGFLTANEYTNKKGEIVRKPLVHIEEASIESAKECIAKPKEKDLPF